MIESLFIKYGLPLLVTLGLVFGIYHQGELHERSLWDKKESKQLVEANQKILDLQNEKYDLEQQNKQDMKHANEVWKKEMQDVQTQAQLALDMYRSGAIKLSIPTVRPASCDSAGVESGITLPRGDETTRSELSGSAVEFLTGEARRANEIVVELTKCQDELTATHKACSQYLNQGEVK